MAEVYIELIGGHQSNLVFDGNDNTGHEGIEKRNYIAISRPTPLKSRLSDAEKKAHLEFLEEDITEALWSKVK